MTTCLSSARSPPPTPGPWERASPSRVTLAHDPLAFSLDVPCGLAVPEGVASGLSGLTALELGSSLGSPFLPCVAGPLRDRETKARGLDLPCLGFGSKVFARFQDWLPAYLCISPATSCWHQRREDLCVCVCLWVDKQGWVWVEVGRVKFCQLHLCDPSYHQNPESGHWSHLQPLLSPGVLSMSGEELKVAENILFESNARAQLYLTLAAPAPPTPNLHRLEIPDACL